MTRFAASVRTRTALVAAAGFAVVVVLGSVIGVRLLRSSLIEEVDRSNDARAQDIMIQTADEEEVPFVAAGLEPSTAAAIVDVDGTVLSSTDDLDGELLLSLYATTEGPFNVSFDGLDTVEGSSTMRGVTVQVIESDEFLESFVFVASSTQSVDRTIAAARTGLLIAVPLLIAIVGALVWSMAGRALRPVELIRSEVEDITGTALDRRVAVPNTRDEIWALAVTMNQMLERVEAASEQQRRFAADASHELRSPLASIAAQLDVDHAHPHTASAAETLSVIRVETRRMQTLVEDLLVVARSDATGLQVGHERVGFDDVVSDALAVHVPRPGVSIAPHEIGRVDVVGSSGDLQRLVINLLANATRHARSCVVVQLTASDLRATLTVDDDGPGIDVADRARIFERFVRLDAARSRDAGGSGLGLALCREICTAHGGAIAVTTSPVGGARFVVSLPLA